MVRGRGVAGHGAALFHTLGPDPPRPGNGRAAGSKFVTRPGRMGPRKPGPTSSGKPTPRNTVVSRSPNLIIHCIDRVRLTRGRDTRWSSPVLGARGAAPACAALQGQCGRACTGAWSIVLSHDQGSGCARPAGGSVPGPARSARGWWRSAGTLQGTHVSPGGVR